MALSQRQMVPTDQEGELLYSKGALVSEAVTAPEAGKRFVLPFVGQSEDAEARRRTAFYRAPQTRRDADRAITPSVSPPTRKARFGTTPSGSGGEL